MMTPMTRVSIGVTELPEITSTGSIGRSNDHHPRPVGVFFSTRWPVAQCRERPANARYRSEDEGPNPSGPIF